MSQNSGLVFITGLPRSGTTMLLLMCSWLNDYSTFTAREMHPLNFIRNHRIVNQRIIIKQPYGYDKEFPPAYTYKQLIDLDMKIIACIRDPRDILVSKHLNDLSRYWVAPEVVERNLKELLEFKDHPRVFIMRYEELINNPQDMMNRIAGFLKTTCRPGYEEFYKHKDADKWKSLGGQRPIESNFRKWELPQHQDRIKTALTPKIQELMKEWGYE